jgi:EAL domain-containing protein (putative c-di-GMP-specific phosphodiesterase class I)/FixJ family two-component response regulator
MSRRAPGPQLAASNQPAVRAAGHAIRGVLIVDDDDTSRRLAHAHLKKLGIPLIHEAESGESALALLAAERSMIDVIICDLKMPTIDGMRLLGMISESGIAPAIIISSAIDEKIIRSVELMAGAHGFDVLGLLPKPAGIDTLRSLLAKHRVLAMTEREPASQVDVAEIGAALASGAIEAYFQPKTELATGRVCGAEALVRWRHPIEGILAPAQFLHLINAAGEMQRMTWLMIESAVAWCKQWRMHGREVNVSVNLSIAAISDSQFPTAVHDLIRNAGLTPDCLIFEVTETNAMHDVAGWLEAFTRLRMHGFGISLDDFGVGFSSLQQLSRIPFTEMKLDRSFVTGAHDRPHLRTVVESTVGLARKLGLRVVGEGVETLEDWRLLREIGADIAQGHFIAKPLPGKDFEGWTRRWSPPTWNLV